MLSRYMLSDSIVFDVLWRLMAPFITRQQHNNIPHVDRTPYSPQRSRGSARPFLLELVSRSTSLLARKLPPSVLTSSAAGCTFLTAWLHVVLCCCHETAFEKLWQNPHWKEAWRHQAGGVHDANSQIPVRRSASQPHESLHQTHASNSLT